MDMGSIFNQLIILFVLIGVGYAANRMKLIPAEMTKGLSTFVITITMPCNILRSVLGMELEKKLVDVLGLIGVTLVVYGFLIVMGFLMPVLLGVKKEDIGIYRFMTVFTNAAFIGFPVVQAIYGEGALFYAMLFQLPFNILVYSFGVWLIAGKDVHISPRQLLLNPCSIAAVLAIVIYLTQISFPAVVSGTLDMIGGLTTPLSMLVIGATLGEMPLKQMFNKWRLYPFAIISNVVLPIILYFILRLFVTDSMMLHVSVIIASMPVAASSTMLCHRYGGDAETASASVFITTAFSVGTIPLLVWLMQLL